MKIEKLSGPTGAVIVENLKYGDCFRFTDDEQEKVFLLANIHGDDYDKIKAINLENGISRLVSINDLVIPVKAKVVVES